RFSPSGGMSLFRSERVWRCRRDRKINRRGRLTTDKPVRHSFTGRIGRGTKPPPQFGHTLCNLCSKQSEPKRAFITADSCIQGIEWQIDVKKFAVRSKFECHYRLATPFNVFPSLYASTPPTLCRGRSLRAPQSFAPPPDQDK